MIRIEGGACGQMRIIGSLEGPAVRVLLEAIARGPLLLDLSEVDRADEAAVRLLAGLPERCTLSGCPHWLQLWIDQLRRSMN
jgi:anti-anti-sigma regulatory factor